MIIEEIKQVVQNLSPPSSQITRPVWFLRQMLPNVQEAVIPIFYWLFLRTGKEGIFSN